MSDKEFCELANDVRDIKEALLGNEYNKGKGALSRLEDHEERISRLEKKVIWATGVGTGVGVIIGFILQLIA